MNTTILKRHRITRQTKAYVWVIPDYYGHNPPRGCSRRVPMAEWKEHWFEAGKKTYCNRGHGLNVNVDLTK